MAVHAAMVDRMDREIGRVLAQLRAMGAADAVVGRLDRDGGWSVGRVAPPFLDVRVAGWLLRPESAELACGVGAGWAR